MKAYVLRNINQFQLEEVPTPSLADNEVLLAVKAAGICGSDIPRVYKTGTYSFPTIPGHEFSGQVVKVGPAVKEDWIGKRVGIFPLIPCRKCGPCLKKQYEMCRSYSYLGSRQDGGFAEYAAVPVDNLLQLPDNVTFEEAAMLEPMAVAVHAMRRVQPKKTDTIAVCGMGTIGLLLVMFLKEAGVENILVIGNKEFQRQAVVKQGISVENFCDSRMENAEQWISDRTNGAGVDIFFECVGKNETVTWAINATIPGGKVMLVGNPYSDMLLDKAVYWKILRHQLLVTGTWNSSFALPGDMPELAKEIQMETEVEDAMSENELQKAIGVAEPDDWRYVLERLAAGRIAPAEFITHRFSLEELEKGFRIMRDKSEDYVKVMGCFKKMLIAGWK